MWASRPAITRLQFENKFEKTASCWIWNGATNPRGYGWFKHVNSHRCAWTIYRGAIPDGKSVLHRCDNPSCVNPEHLFLGDQEVNMQDMDQKGRRITPDRKGQRNGRSKLNESDVFAIRLSSATPRFLAAFFGVSRNQISAIKTRRAWKHV